MQAFLDTIWRMYQNVQEYSVTLQHVTGCHFWATNMKGSIVFNATFNNSSVISWGQFYWWRKPEYPVKTTDLPQDTDFRTFETHQFLFLAMWDFLILH